MTTYRTRLLGGHTLTAVAAKSGVSLPMVSQVLAGKREPSVSIAARMAKVVQLELSEWYRLYRKHLATFRVS